MREIDLEPDPDTRYRVNEFFCAGEIWVAAARHLMQRCDVVVIIFGSFTQAGWERLPNSRCCRSWALWARRS